MLIDLVRLGLRSRAFAPDFDRAIFGAGLAAVGIARRTASLYGGRDYPGAGQVMIVQTFDGATEVRGSGGSLPVKTGETLLLTSASGHDFGPPEGAAWSSFFLTLTGPEIIRLARLIHTRAGPRHTIGQLAIDALATCCFEALTDPESSAGSRSAIAYRAMAILAEECLLPRIHVETSAPDWLQGLVDFIAKNIGAELDVATLAAKAGLSRAHFVRTFTQAMRCPPSDYVQRLRISRAADLLLVPETSVADAAKASGFADPDLFARAFRRLTGMSPTAYRQSRGFAARLSSPQRRPRSA